LHSYILKNSYGGAEGMRESSANWRRKKEMKGRK